MLNVSFLCNPLSCEQRKRSEENYGLWIINYGLSMPRCEATLQLYNLSILKYLLVLSLFNIRAAVRLILNQLTKQIIKTYGTFRFL